MTGWRIQGAGAHVEVNVLSYERASATDQSDANWLRCRASGSFNGFSCIVDYSIMTADFRQFGSALQEMLDGRVGDAYFITAEEGLEIQVHQKPSGQCIVSGYLRSLGMPKAKLEFRFDSDQSYIRQALIQLTETNQRFPVRAV